MLSTSFGLLILIATITVAALPTFFHRLRPPSAPTVGILAAVSLVLILRDQVSEFSVIKDLANIKFARTQAVEGATQIRDMADQVREILRKVESQSKAISVADQTASEAKKTSETANNAVKAAESQLKEISTALDRANQGVRTLDQISTFNRISTGVQNDERADFDQIRKWAKDSNYPLKELAQRVWASTLISVESADMWEYQYPPGRDPQKLTYEQLLNDYKSLNDGRSRIAVLDTIVNKRQDVTKRKKFEFLANVLGGDPSLRVVCHAGSLFMKLSEDKFRPLAIDEHLAWWQRNKHSVH